MYLGVGCFKAIISQDMSYHAVPSSSYSVLCRPLIMSFAEDTVYLCQSSVTHVSMSLLTHSPRFAWVESNVYFQSKAASLGKCCLCCCLVLHIHYLHYTFFLYIFISYSNITSSIQFKISRGLFSFFISSANRIILLCIISHTQTRERAHNYYSVVLYVIKI